ncbi:MAG: flagellar protein export ATPase FliI [Gammaproteobacteria bacterium]
MTQTNRNQIWQQRLAPYKERLQTVSPIIVEGKLTRMAGLTLEAEGCEAAVSDRCLIKTNKGRSIEAEVVGFSGEKLFLMPIGSINGLAPGSRVIPIGSAGDVPVGYGLLGRVIDGTGRPLDDKGPLQTDENFPLQGRRINPLKRHPIDAPLDVGVRAINTLLSVGGGQRLGLFAPSGVGKSVLLGMMTRFTSADVIVVGLIGERGREVKEFIDHILDDDARERSVVVATPADMPPLMRMHGAATATSIAEYFRDQGKHVLLLMDSLTRYAQAHREIALAIGEPPATKGFPPSVFAQLPHLVERAGNGDQGGGSITAFYTVLMEGDGNSDPVAESARAILDGHIVLSRSLAESGHFPAIDIEASISRAMNQVTSTEHQQTARDFRHYFSLYEQNKDLLNVGAYQAGTNPDLDRAIELQPYLQAFLRQGMDEKVTLQESLNQLSMIIQAQVTTEPEVIK